MSCLRPRELPASQLVLWEPTHRRGSRGHPTPTSVDVLRKGVAVGNTGELARRIKKIGNTAGRVVQGRPRVRSFLFDVSVNYLVEQRKHMGFFLAAIDDIYKILMSLQTNEYK